VRRSVHPDDAEWQGCSGTVVLSARCAPPLFAVTRILRALYDTKWLRTGTNGMAYGRGGSCAVVRRTGIYPNCYIRTQETSDLKSTSATRRTGGFYQYPSNAGCIPTRPCCWLVHFWAQSTSTIRRCQKRWSRSWVEGDPDRGARLHPGRRTQERRTKRDRHESL